MGIPDEVKACISEVLAAITTSKSAVEALVACVEMMSKGYCPDAESKEQKFKQELQDATARAQEATARARHFEEQYLLERESREEISAKQAAKLKQSEEHIKRLKSEAAVVGKLKEELKHITTEVEAQAAAKSRMLDELQRANRELSQRLDRQTLEDRARDDSEARSKGASRREADLRAELSSLQEELKRLKARMPTRMELVPAPERKLAPWHAHSNAPSERSSEDDASSQRRWATTEILSRRPRSPSLPPSIHLQSREKDDDAGSRRDRSRSPARRQPAEDQSVCIPFVMTGTCVLPGCAKRHPAAGDIESVKSSIMATPCKRGARCFRRDCVYDHPRSGARGRSVSRVRERSQEPRDDAPQRNSLRPAQKSAPSRKQKAKNRNFAKGFSGGGRRRGKR